MLNIIVFNGHKIISHNQNAYTKALKHFWKETEKQEKQDLRWTNNVVECLHVNKRNKKKNEMKFQTDYF